MKATSKLAALISEGESQVLEFDGRICGGFVYPRDFSVEAYSEWCATAMRSRGEPPERLLPKLNVAELAKRKLLMSNAGVLMFAENPVQFIPHAQISFIVFASSSKTRIIKRQDTQTSMPRAIEETLTYIEKYMANAHEINVPENGARRVEHPEYSLAALREILVNAVAHRDWSVAGGTIMVEMYTDRLVVKSPGGLLPGITVDNMDQKCERRNPLLADLLSRAGYGERAGTGVAKIYEACEELDSPSPVFEADSWVQVTLYPSRKSRLEHLK